jgi:hypothetical protein
VLALLAMQLQCMKAKKFLLLVAMSTLFMVSCTSKTSTPADSGAGTATTSEENIPQDEPLADDVESSEAENEEQILAATDAESGWAATYAGKLDGKIEVTLEIKGLGDVLRGTITYKKSGKPILVLGSFNTDGTFFLREYQPDGNVTGVMSGTEKSKKLTGTWYPPGTDKEMKLDLDAVTVQEEGTVSWPYGAIKIAGEYGYHYGKEGPMGSLTVKQSGDQVKFAFDCNTGAPGFNMAMLEETTATLKDGEVRYKMPDAECEIRIQFFDGFAVVGYVDEKYDCGFGHNAGVEGEFVKLK